MAVETTLVLVKPDGMRRRLAGEILARLERRGLELRGARLLKITRPLAQQHYAEHKGKPFFGGLVDVHHLGRRCSRSPCAGSRRSRSSGR